MDMNFETMLQRLKPEKEAERVQVFKNHFFITHFLHPLQKYPVQGSRLAIKSYVTKKYQNMENTGVSQPDAVSQIYNYAANLLLNENKNVEEVKDALVEKGLSADAAYTIVRSLEDQISQARKERATKDMIYGALWCVGGTIATVANIGFIFWGAILFGGIQFFKGVIN